MNQQDKIKELQPPEALGAASVSPNRETGRADTTSPVASHFHNTGGSPPETASVAVGSNWLRVSLATKPKMEGFTVFDCQCPSCGFQYQAETRLEQLSQRELDEKAYQDWYDQHKLEYPTFEQAWKAALAHRDAKGQMTNADR